MTAFAPPNKNNTSFDMCLKSRVHAYFSGNAISRNAINEMVLKSIAAMGLYLAPFVIMLWLAPASIPLLFGLWILMGLGKAFVGTSVMHESMHRSYSQKKYVYQLMAISAWLVGIDPTIWKVQHHVLHHSFTNIAGADEEVEPRYILRFSPNQPRRWFHRYQHLYAPVLYAISTLLWSTVKDFVKAFQYHNMGHLKSMASFPLYLAEIILRKLSYFIMFLIIPVYILPVSAGMVIGMFIVMHVIAGTLLSMIFQPAHVVETSAFYESKSDGIKDSWLIHQLRTTSNFGVKSKLLFWFSGGLNHQIEHHLFPNVCHLHYKHISKIVKTTSAEYGLPYHTEATLGSASSSHLKMLKPL